MNSNLKNEELEQCLNEICSVNNILVDVSDLIRRYQTYKASEMTFESQFDLLIDICSELLVDQNYDKLGARLMIYKMNNFLKGTALTSFIKRQNFLNNNLKNFMNKQYIDYINNNADIISSFEQKFNELPDYMSIFGFKTVLKLYSIKVGDINIETPFDVFLRCAIGLWFKDSDFSQISATFEYIYKGQMIHASPTLFNAGTNIGQLSSCFVLGMGDSINSIYKTLTDCAKISKKCGGIGFSISNIRGSGALIKTSNGQSANIVSMLRLYDTSSHYVSQGGQISSRKGAYAAFLEIWHKDIIEFIGSKLQNGDHYKLLRDLNIGLMIPDVFMKQLEINGSFYLMCPEECPGLCDTFGEEFETLYWKYVKENKFKTVILASELMEIIRRTVTEAGEPYMLFKDNINRRSNQSNIGMIKSSNLCCEITEVSDENTQSVCNLASISVNRFLNSDKTYNYDELVLVSRQITRNLNNCIDYNSYPTEESERTNSETRPIGIGIQGMANLFLELKIPYESQEALDLEFKIMEAIYYGAVCESNYIAETRGKKYKFFENSPFSKGIFQFDMIPEFDYGRLNFNWEDLRQNVIKHGMSNSLLTALMPTATTSQILGNHECFEPITSNFYVRKTSSGSFKNINNNLVEDLKRENLWSETLKDKIIANAGIISSIPEIPEHIKLLHKTVWEIKQKSIMDHAIARSPFVDQSQSMNLYFDTVTSKKFIAAMKYAWSNGLKTGSYYIKTQPSHNATDKVFSVKSEGCVSCSA